MRIYIAIAATVLSAGTAFAATRYDAQSLSCDRVHSLIEKNGAVVLRYNSPRNPSVVLYDKYVSGAGYCSGGAGRLSRVEVPISGRTGCEVQICSNETTGRFGGGGRDEAGEDDNDGGGNDGGDGGNNGGGGNEDGGGRGPSGGGGGEEGGGGSTGGGSPTEGGFNP